MEVEIPNTGIRLKADIVNENLTFRFNRDFYLSNELVRAITTCLEDCTHMLMSNEEKLKLGVEIISNILVKANKLGMIKSDPFKNSILIKA